MKLVTFKRHQKICPGVLLSDQIHILDITKVMPQINSLISLIKAGEKAMASLINLLASPPPDSVVPVSTAEILAPIPEPGRNIFCVGKKLP